MANFDAKSFNPQAFGKYMETIPALRLNTLIKSNIFKSNENIKNALSLQTGSAYAIIPMFGRLTGSMANYDGATGYGDAKKLNTYEQGVVAIGRKDKFGEKDFSYDVTSGVDFMSQVGTQVKDYVDTNNEDILISIVKGLFASNESDFTNNHTTTANSISVSTLNSAIQKACGDRKQKFSFVIMNSAIATGLENEKVLNYLKYTDENGIEADLNLAQWNGKLVLVDDSITTDSVTSGDTTTNYYVTYVFGNGAFDYVDLGAKVPYEMTRDENNDMDLLYVRERIAIAPFGFSYTKSSQATNSPTNSELANGSNWALVKDASNNKINHKEIAIAKIVTPVSA